MKALQRFADIPWTQIAPQAFEKRVDVGANVLRLLRFEPGFAEPDWCQAAHVGFIVKGTLSIQFAQSSERLTAGDYIAIDGGEQSKHRAVVTDSVTLFLVEPNGS